MKILHTADIHLRKINDDRWRALSELIKIGKKHKIELFVISGDLFDKDIKAEKLRPKMGKLFSGNGFKIIIIPGNHDKNSYEDGLHFGSDVEIMSDFGCCFENKSLKIIALPFEELSEEEVFERVQSLKNELSIAKQNIIVCHGELLDVYFSRRDFGDEGEARYMPFKLSHFNDLNINYVLAGHFHTNFQVRKLKGGGYFVYPGSPISITKRETGQRRANLFEIGKEPKEILLDTPYYDEINVDLDPFGKKKSIDIIKEGIKIIRPNARPIINVKGFFNGEKENTTEKKLVEDINKIIPKNAELKPPEIRDVKSILEDDLFKGFKKRLEESKLDKETKNHILEIAIEGMTEVKKA